MSNSLLSLSGQDDPRSFLPEGWVTKQLGSICEIFGGGRLGLTKEKDYQSTGVTAFSAAGPDGYVEKVEVHGKDGVVLSAIGANCGRCFFASGDWTTLANVQAILPKGEIEAKYLFYYVNRDRYWDRSGSAQPFIKPSSIHSSWVVYPPNMVEQVKIAEVLSTLDRAIEQTEALIAKQQRIKTGLMQDLLTKGIDEHGNIRSEATHAFKDSPLGRIPVEWEALPLAKLVDEPITYGIVQAGPHQEGGIPYIRTGDMSGDKIDGAQLLLTTPSIAEAYKRSEVQTGDIVFALRATVGKVLPVTADLAGANLTQGTAKISPSDNVDSAFLLWALRTEAVLRSIQLVQKGTTFAEITLGDLRQVYVATPQTLGEQQQIARNLDACFELLQRHRRQSEKLQSVKQGLMHDLLTGERRVTALLAPAATR